jgi:hypothetical protein
MKSPETDRPNELERKTAGLSLRYSVENHFSKAWMMSG